MKKTFQAWQQIFETKKLDTTKDLHFITALEIKAITHVEPRIMAKMDSTSDLPPVFRKNGYFLLPVSNGKYAIVRGRGFHKLEPRSDVEKYLSQIKFPLTTASRGQSEMQYLDYSFNTGAIEYLIDCGPLYQSIRGERIQQEVLVQGKFDQAGG